MGGLTHGIYIPSHPGGGGSWCASNISVLIYELLNLFFSSVADPSTNDFYCIVFHLYFISIFQRTRCDNN